AQQRLPFAFDAGVAKNPGETAQKIAALAARLPAGFSLPASFVPLQSAPNGVSTPTTSIWLASEMRDAFWRAADAGTGPMAWPPVHFCTEHMAFGLPSGSLLAAGAAASCMAQETALRTHLAQTTLDACIDAEEPERYVSASLIPSGTPLSQIPAIV